MKLFYRVTMLVALALTELHEAKVSVKHVLKELYTKLVRLILKKYKGAKL